MKLFENIFNDNNDEIIECTGFHETCNCPDCEYANQLYSELDYLENFEPNNLFEIDRIKEELDSLGYSY